MYPEPTPHPIDPPPHRHPHLHHPAPESGSTPGGLHLSTLDRTIDASDALSRPLVAMLVTEDFCWHAARTDWRTRKPLPWHRAQWRAWHAEGRLLDQKRSRIRDLADDLGLLTDRRQPG